MLSRADKEPIHRRLDRLELKDLNYPPGYEEKDNRIFYKGRLVTNYILKIVLYIIIVEPPDHEDELYCILQYSSGADPPDELDERRMFKIDVSKLDNPNYLKQVMPKQCLSFYDTKSISKFLAQAIKSVLFKMEPIELVHTQPGPHYHNGVPYFGHGDMTICADPSIEFYNDSKHELKEHSMFTSGFTWLMKYMSYSWTSPIELLTDLSTSVLHFFPDSDRRFALWVYGKTAVGKTVSASLAFDHFTDHANYRKLSSDKDAINTADIPGCTFVLEDFSKNKSHRIFESNMEKVEDMISRFQSPAPTIRKGVRCDLSGNLAITAEVKPKNKSTVNRCVFHKKEVQFVPNELSDLLDHSAQVITLKNDFIWFNLLHEKEIRSNMKSYLEFCNPPADDYEGTYETNYRVQRNKQTLKVTLLLFMNFLRDRSGMLADSLDKIEKRFNDSIEQSICETYNVLKAYVSKDEHSKYVTGLAHMIWAPQEVRLTNWFPVFTQHSNSFMETGKGKYLFFYDEYENDACIHSDTLLCLFYDEKLGLTTEQFRKMLFSDLKKAHVIDFCGDSSTYPIKDHDRKKRYIHLRLDKLRCIYLSDQEKENPNFNMALADRSLEYETQKDIEEEREMLRQKLAEDTPDDFENFPDL